MSKLLHRSLLAGSIMTIVAACGGGDEANTPAAGGRADSASAPAAKAVSESVMWSTIDASTPFLFAYDMSAMDRDLMNRLLANNKASMEGLLTQLKSTETTDPAEKLAVAVVEELATITDVASLEALGFSADGFTTFSANGIDPVLRFSLSDEEAFMAMVERVALQAEMELPEATMHEDHRVWEVPMEQAGGLVIGVGGGHASVGTVADLSDTDAKEHVLGIQKPENSLADSDRIESLQSRYGFDGINVGFLAVADLLNAITADGSNPIKDRIIGVSGSPELVPAACVELVRSVGEVMPQVAFGTTRTSADALDIRSVIELTGDTPAQLQAIAAPVPGMGAAVEESLARISLAISLPDTRTALTNLTSGLSEVNGDCPWIQQEQLDNLNRSAMQLANPMFAGIKGLHLDLESLDLQPGMMMPNDVRAQLLVASDNPLGLLGLAAMASPQLAQLDVKTDSQPVALGPEIIPPLVPAPHLAASESALAMSVGEGNQENLGDFLAGPTSDQATLMRMSYDAAEVAEMMKAQMEAAAQDGSTANFNASSLSAFDWVEIHMYANDNGLVIDQTSHMRD